MISAVLLAVLPFGGALAQTAKPPAAEASLIENMAAELREMRERVETLETELTQMREGARAAQEVKPTATPSWTDDSPRPETQVTSRTGDDTPLEKPVLPAALQIDRGKFPIETFGQIQYDFSYVANPNNAINTTNLGYNGTARRLIFGFRGGLPGGFRYNLEFMLARELVDYEDVTLSWEPEGLFTTS